MGRSYHILVVDDEEAIREFMVDFLGEEGHRVVTAADGFEAVQAVKDNHDLDLIFLDIKLPYMDGLGVLRKVKALRPRIKVVMITAYPDDAYIFGTMAAEAEVKADGFIAKPFSMDMVRDCIVMLMERGKKYLGTSDYMKSLARRSVKRSGGDSPDED